MELNGKDLQFEFDKTKPDIPTTVILECSKAKDELGWTPQVDVTEGLRRTSEWYKDNVQ